MNLFQFWPRYVARVLRVNAVYRGEYMDWKIEAEVNDSPTQKDFEQSEKRPYPVWDNSELYPWNMANRLSSFPYPDMFWTIKYSDKRKVKSKLTIYDAEKAIIFKGDRVKVLVGPDKGKNGIVVSNIKMRNLVIVDGLNCIYVKMNNTEGITRKELPLHIETEVALIDPQDNKVCEVEWRYDETGQRVRVSKRTERIIPMPAAAEALDDGTIPSLQVTHPVDTLESELVKVTYKPVLKTFTEDILERNGINDKRTRAKTYWY